MQYRVTAGKVTIETTLPGGGRAHVDIPRGAILPDDARQDQIDWELKLGTIEPVTGEAAGDNGSIGAGGMILPPPPPDPDALPDGMSVPTTLEWVGDNPARAQVAYDAETGPAGQNRATLVDRLLKAGAVVPSAAEATAPEGVSPDAGADSGASVDS